jgi:hypothetical protein
MVLSPERADGLDLKALTRAAMNQLGHEAGGTPPWIAAIHRNTKHPHVHMVMAARRELEPGHFRNVVISPARLSHMKLAITNELSLQRSHTPRRTPLRGMVAGIDKICDWQPSRRGRSTGVIGGLAQIIDRALHGIAAHQRREMQRWLMQEEERMRRDTLQ